MPPVTIYLKCSDSRPGYDVCMFLDSNIDRLKQSGVQLQVKIVGSKGRYGCAPPKGVKALPALVRRGDTPLVGQAKIIQYLASYTGGGKKRAANPDDEMADHWRSVLDEGDEQGDQGQAMERAKRMAIEETYRHKEVRKPSRASIPSGSAATHQTSSSPQDDDNLEDYMDGEDPAMVKYWQNQSES